jgi:hypothetical protein
LVESKKQGGFDGRNHPNQSANRHPAAIVGTASAGFGTGPAVVMVMFGALSRTGITDLSAERHKLGREPGIAGGQAGAHRAEIGAVAAEPDAGGHHLNVVFGKAGGGALFARFGTIEAGSDVIGVLHGFHNVELVLLGN